MDTYRPLHTKYRPRKFAQLVGQDRLVKTLTGLLDQDRLYQSFLLSGPWGSGKTTTARLIAARLNCRQPEGPEPCGECPSCQAVFSGTHRDVTEINAADTRGIDAIRELISVSRIAAQLGSYRVFILDEVHQLTPQAFQALLKVLEEPPPRTVYVLCTTEPQQLPPTIVSRTLHLQVQLPEVKTVARHVAKIYKAETGKKLSAKLAMAIARTADRHIRDALVLLEHVIAARAEIPEAELEALAQRVLEDATHLNARKFVPPVLKAIYGGKVTSAVDAARKWQQVGSRTDQFIQALLDVHGHVIALWASEKLKDPMWADVLARFDRQWLRQVPLDVYVEFHAELLEALRKCKTYLYPEHHLLLNVLVRGAWAFRKHRKAAAS